MLTTSIGVENQQWHVLLIYNFYRLLSIFLFLGIYYSSYNTVSYDVVFFITLSIYLCCAVFFFYCGYKHSPEFEKQIFLFGTIDIVVIATILNIISNMPTGQGILLNVTIAALGILVPGRLTVFFAALASCMLLGANLAAYFLHNQRDFSSLYYSGIYGAGFFATAATAWYLSNRVRISESIAAHRGNELESMQKINEYIVERLHSGIIYVNDKKEIILINSAAREFFNLSDSSNLVHLKDASLVLNNKFDAFINNVSREENSFQSIMDEPCLQVYFFSIVVAEKPAVLIMLEDRANIAQQAQQLKLASLGRFSASIAHEIRNPLGVIAHAAQLLGEIEALHVEDQHLKELIISNCARMNGVIKNVLQLSRREQAKPDINKLHVFLGQFKKNFCPNSENTLTIELPKKQLAIVFDRSQLEQVLVILCENALTHGKDESGIAHIVLKAHESKGKVIISVSDAGSGIPPENVETIFEPFFTTLSNGTGMGLFIAKDLCEINQAQLSLNPSSIGCTFSITQKIADELL